MDDLPPKAQAVDAVQQALNELPPDVLTAATALGALHALHAVVPVIVARLRERGEQGWLPGEGTEAAAGCFYAADLIEREFGSA